MKKRLFSLLLAAVWLGQCTDDGVVSGARDGVIRGKVLDLDSAGIRGAEIFIPGTSLSARTDSTGSYTFYGVPTGEYRLCLPVLGGDTVVLPVTVAAGETTLASTQTIDPIWDFQGDLLFDFSPIDRNNQPAGGFKVRDDSINIGFYYYADYYRRFGVPAIIINDDTLAFYLNIKRSDFTVEQVIIRQNQDTIFDSIPRQGVAYLHPVVRSGSDTFTVRVNQRKILEFYVQDSASLAGNYVNIVVGSTPMPKCDWDLYLINDSTGDSCYWQNPNPDWGRNKKGSDDPICSDGGIAYYYSFRFYVQPSIEVLDLQPGTYSVGVRYFDGPADSVLATPQINVQLRSPGYQPPDTSYSLSPTQPLAKGELWLAGRIHIPELTFTAIDSILAP